MVVGVGSGFVPPDVPSLLPPGKTSLCSPYLEMNSGGTSMADSMSLNCMLVMRVWCGGNLGSDWCAGKCRALMPVVGA